MGIFRYLDDRTVSCIVGFRIPSFPRGKKNHEGKESIQYYKKFISFLTGIHRPNHGIAFSLFIAAKPHQTGYGADVNFNIVIRANDETEAAAAQKVSEFANSVVQSLPNEILLGFGTPVPLQDNELSELFLEYVDKSKIARIEIDKYKEYFTAAEKSALPPELVSDPIYHPFFCSAGSPWLRSFDMLGNSKRLTIVSISVEPVRWRNMAEFENRAQKIRDVIEIDRSKLSLVQSAAGQQRQDGINPYRINLLKNLYQAGKINGKYLAYTLRHQYYLKNLISFQSQLFIFRIMIAAEGRVDSGLVEVIRKMTSEYDKQEDAMLGWMSGTKYEPTRGDFELFLKDFRNITVERTYLHRYPEPLQIESQLITAEEAAIFFNLPVVPYEFNNSVVEINEAPFFIPSNLAKATPDFNTEIALGKMYQKDAISPVSFNLPVEDLQKPSILVGAPGSGKSNLALSILSKLWSNLQTPFLVIDPSTGHEYRYLLADPSLKNSLIVFTCGDEETTPFRFNPFEVPPGVTVRAHITRLMSCFKAAYEMWDPLTSIYESALIKLYSGGKFGWSLDERGVSGNNFPCLSDFYQQLLVELETNVLPDFGEGTENAGTLLGSSKQRVSGIINSVGNVINVKGENFEFFQRLLDRPAVIELGDVGDSNNIALVMAFLVVQLMGHIEYSFMIGKRKERIHLLLIEEAHRLLSAESSISVGQNQGNTQAKSAEDLNNLLAEVRKFREGIMVLDQRPSSLVGGVLDNSLINIMCRLNDKNGFLHLANVLNLDEAQQKYARTRMKPGDFVILDRVSGFPVLARGENIVDRFRDDMGKFSSEEIRSQLRKNIRSAGLIVAEKPAVFNSTPSVPSVDRDNSLVMDSKFKQLWAELEQSLIDYEGILSLLTESNSKEDDELCLKAWKKFGSGDKLIIRLLLYKLDEMRRKRT